MKLHILTVANESRYYYPYLIESIRRNNNELITLGFNQKWGGFNTKFIFMHDKLKDLDENDLVCFVDGFDVICIRDLNELKDAFLEIKDREGCNIIAGHDYIIKNIFRSIISSLYFTKTFNSTVINSGTYIGYVKDIKKFLLFVLSKDDNELADDQILMNTYNKLYPKEIYIDVNTELFLTISKPLENIINFIKIKNKTIYFNNNKPFFIHAAGSGYMNDILEELDYTVDKQIEIDLKNNFNKKIFEQFFKNNIIKNINKYNILFSFILFLIIYEILKSF